MPDPSPILESRGVPSFPDSESGCPHPSPILGRVGCADPNYIPTDLARALTTFILIEDVPPQSALCKTLVKPYAAFPLTRSSHGKKKLKKKIAQSANSL